VSKKKKAKTLPVKAHMDELLGAALSGNPKPKKSQEKPEEGKKKGDQ